ncbi:18482_t:CDS:2 [Dentiscutata erythropus]|uniref:18482_t:CDS:1 n=1 Tax=Dentiscutata erythropus TaxID=1348616 RepID=A0A9N9EE81_9GLOM|nr:18482_t:CDS:2 [Dentiscutata erythropus]
MVDLNPVLENLKQRDIQQVPLKLIYADNDFAVFDKGSSEFYVGDPNLWTRNNDVVREMKINAKNGITGTHQCKNEVNDYSKM